MGIGPITTARSGGDDRWMGSRHAVAEAHPGTLKASAFDDAEGVTDGIVPSGYPLTLLVDGTYGPRSNGDPDATPTPIAADPLAGFSIDDRDISNGDEPTAVMWHGRIKVDYLPIEFTAPTTGTAFAFEEN